MAGGEGDAEVLSEAEIEDAKAIFEGRNDKAKACHFCAGIHNSVAGLYVWQQPCPRVKRVQRFANGELAEVEFWEPGRWEQGVVFPTDVYEVEEED